jgi:ABC-type branched-subunit amino acid transport system permease subunit
MKRHLAWWTVLVVLIVAWVPFGIDWLFDKVRGLNYIPDSEVALMFGFWLFVWWPCHIAIALILLYKVSRWIIGRLRTLNSN